jgi:alpha-galactosidase
MAKKSVKIVAIGVASAFGRGTIAEILGTPEFNDLNCTLTLVDLNADALETMYKFGLLLKDHFNSSVKLERTTDRREALKGANYVITSVAIKRYPLWEQDFRLPLAYGFRHVLGENGGPGAMFHAMRNYELMLPIARDMEKYCPNALLLNFTNPESRIIMAVSTLTKIRCVGLCHGVMESREGISKILEKPLDSLDIVTGGINHFFWVLKIADKKTGKDLYPKLVNRVLNDPECPCAPPLVKKMVEIFGCFTYPSDDHIGEYLTFAYEFTGLKWHYGQECKPTPLVDEVQVAGLHGIEPYVAGEKELDDWATRKSGELAVPIILGVEFNRGNWECAVNIPNDAGYVENIQRDAVVEVPAVIDKKGVHPQKVGRIPDALAAFCNRQVAIQRLVVEGYAKKSKNTLLQALLLDPLVDNVGRAKQLLEDMLELQKDYLPKFK